MSSQTPLACVMIVEDNPSLNQLLAEALEEAGCTVVQAFDGLQAYELVRQHWPRVILLDLDLPRLYGHLVLRSLARTPDTAEIQVVVLTGRPSLLTDDDRALAAAVLHKPAAIDEILGAVRAALAASNTAAPDA